MEHRQHKQSDKVDNCTATGLYCALIPTHLFKTTPFRIEKIICQGPDVNFGLDITLKGYTNLAVWETICGHVLQDRTIWPDQNTGQLSWAKDDTHPGGWKQVQLEDANSNQLGTT